MHWAKPGTKEYNEQMRAYMREYRRHRRLTDPEYVERMRIKSRRHAWKRLGIDLDSINRPEPERCEACNGPPSRAPRNNAPRLHCDHDHKTGKFRGWLCRKCNWAAAYLDTAEELKRLEQVKAYLNQAR